MTVLQVKFRNTLIYKLMTSGLFHPQLKRIKGDSYFNEALNKARRIHLSQVVCACECEYVCMHLASQPQICSHTSWTEQTAL